MKVDRDRLAGIRAAVFDLDGTLVDSRGHLASSFYSTLDRHYPNMMSYAAVEPYFRVGFYRILVERNLDNFQEIMNEFHSAWSEKYHERSPLFTGVREGLRELRQRGIELAVVTNQRRALAWRVIEAHDLARYFTCIVTDEDVPKLKPSPLGIGKALQQMHVKPEECAMVGDSVADVLAARQAQVAAVVLDWYDQGDLPGGELGDYVFSDFKQFVAALNPPGGSKMQSRFCERSCNDET